jgi:hypothetical protein
MNLSINQIAQIEGDTNANEVKRIKTREAAVRRAYREYAYNIGTPTAVALMARASAIAEEPINSDYIKLICERDGSPLK